MLYSSESRCSVAYWDVCVEPVVVVVVDGKREMWRGLLLRPIMPIAAIEGARSILSVCPL